MMITQNLLLLTCSSLLMIVLLQYLFATSQANSSCSPSACGNIRNITDPFRLKNDPSHCGDRRFELACENNVTSIYINSKKYHVKEINYHNFTIRVADVSITNNTCSILVSSSALFNYSEAQRSFDPYLLGIYESQSQLITFVSCPYPLSKSSPLTEVTDCSGRHTYMKVGRMYAREVDHMCTVDFLLPTYWNYTDLNDASLSQIHQSLLYGFQLSWFHSFVCPKHCNGGTYCYYELDGQITCRNEESDLYYKWRDVMRSFRPPKGPTAGYLMILLLIAGALLILCCSTFLFPGISIYAKVIIGFGASYWVLVKDWKRADIERILVVSFGVRFIVGILCAMCFLIYKFHRRHVSMYDVIEDFLESDNKLIPIRYSYSDLKKMTRGFKEKLGVGGFGSVYKGKLRSGHDVAVKLLEKTRANDQDFINEIATIGRIHHVNVVKLVGYSAERSKRALIFDFMPNGSLEKYISNRAETHCLDWDTKFQIAVGVARGIEYLHCGCDIQILHFDIKPHNILLDDQFVPKVSDFGLAKLCSIEKDTVTLTNARGTIGYVAPELINRSIGRVSYKADVYSFGMLLIEMVGLKRNLIENDGSSKYFPGWIYDHFNQGRDIEIGRTDKNNANGDNDNTRRLVRKMTIVALWCIQMSPDDRPSMNEVLKMLEGDNDQHLKIPEYQSQSIQITVNVEQTGTTYSTDSVSLLCRDSESPNLNISNV